MKNLVILTATLINFNMFSQTLNWAKQITGTYGEAGKAIGVDKLGNVYIGGYFETSAADFDPSTAVFSLSATGNPNSCFIMKLNNMGDFIWAKQLEGNVDLKSMFVDTIGNIYSAGAFTSYIDFDPSSSNATSYSAGNGDGFISKLDANGNFVWGKTISGTGGESVTGIKVDKYNNVFFTGQFSFGTDFNPGAGTYTMNPVGAGCYFEKLDANGNFLWANQISGSIGANSFGFDIDSRNNVYACGSFISDVDFDPSIATYTLTANIEDPFVLKFDSLGNFLWAKQFKGTVASSSGKALALKLDKANNVHITGYYTKTLDFDPGVSVVNLSATASSKDVFICKLDSLGNFIWAKNISGQGDEEGYVITVDDNGNVYTGGYFWQGIDADPSTTVNTINAVGINDAFVSILNASGNYVAGFGIGTTAFDETRGIITDNNSFYITGVFRSGAADFDPSSSSTYTLAAVDKDAFIAKYTISNASTGLNDNRMTNVSFGMHPNPTEGIFNISAKEESELKIFNEFGQLVFLRESINGITSINISELPAGIYNLQLSNEKQTNVVKLIKL